MNLLVRSLEKSEANRLFTADDVYKLIADGVIAFDLYRDDISQTHRSLVFRDMTSMEFRRHLNDNVTSSLTKNRPVFGIKVGAEVVYEELVYTVALLGDSNVVLQCGDQTVEFAIDTLERLFNSGRITIRAIEEESTGQSDILNALSPLQLEKALARAKLLEAAKTDPASFPFSRRTLQRIKKRLREAGDGVLEQTIALATNEARRGNRARKIPRAVLDLMDATIEKVYDRAAGGSMKHAYICFSGECFNQGLTPCSERTFFRRIKELSSTKKREGKRRDYQVAKPIVWYLQLDEPIHGVRPFQFVHIDHTPLDLLLTFPQGRESLGKAWCSLAIDADTRAIVGFALSFEPPSFRSCMMVIRDIVRRHRRMPEMIITDNGMEFHSTSFQRLCDLYRTHLRFRPAAQPRHGSVMERIFGTTNTQFIHNLSGNTTLMKHVRTVTKSVNPINFTEWTLPALHGGLDFYFSSIYGKEPHPAHGHSPSSYLSSRLVETGVRRNRWVQFDHTLMIETSPGPKGIDTRIIDGQRGVKVNHIWYWTDAFANARWRGKSVTVRIDPWDIRKIYVLLGNHWHCCVSKLVFALKRYTSVELQYAYVELLKAQGRGRLSPERCAEWLRLYRPENFDARLRMQQSEAKYLYDNLGMSDVGGFEITSNEPKTSSHDISVSHDLHSNGRSTTPLTSKGKDVLVSTPEESQLTVDSNDCQDEYELY